MNTKALRQKVLDLAIHGKLVPQNPNDESATVLLEKIRAEKAEKIKKGELKADKKDSFIFVGSDKRHYEQFADGTVKDIEDEIPFDVPEGWTWCRLGELFYHTTGKALKKSNNKGSLRKYITTSNLYWNKFDFTEVREMYFTDDELDKCTIKKGDLVLCNGGDVGRAAIWNFDEEICYQNHVSRLRPKITEINIKLYLYLLMFYKEQGMLNGKGVGITSLSANDLLSGLFPLPPINEQNQIVIKIENIFSQIDYIDENKSDLQTAIKQIKSKILDLAIHGKLVPQDPNDEPASVLLEKIRAEKEAKIAKGELKRDKNDSFIYKSTTDNCHYEKFADGSIINIEDKIPFDGPEGWNWCRLSEYLDIRDGTHDSPKFYDTGIPFVTSKNLNNGKLDFSECKYITEEDHKKFSARSFVEDGDILFAMIGSIGNPVMVKKEFDFSFKNMALFKCYSKENTNMKYIYFYLYHIQKELKEIATGGVQSFIGLGTFREMLFPLPPLAEQKKIVKILEQVLPLCEKLEIKENTNDK